MSDKGDTGSKGKAMEKAPGKVFMAFLGVGVIVCFTAFGWAMEHVTQARFGENNDERFTYTTLLVFFQCVVNSVLSAAILGVLYGKDVEFSAGAPVSEWLVVALGYLGAHQFGLMALKYISFPMQVVCKSCKAIPVMFGEKILAKVDHSARKKISVFLMCGGVVLFTLMGKQKTSKTGTSFEIGFGLCLVVMALICDGIYGPYQNKITKAYSPSGFHLMFNMNAWEGLFSLLLALGTGQLTDGLAFMQKYPQIVSPIMIYAATMALGNIFIYQLQRNYGALVVTTTTTLRKLISVLFSVFWFGHSMANEQWLGVCVVFLAPQIADLVLFVSAQIKGPEEARAKVA